MAVQVPLGGGSESAGDRIMRSLDNRITREPKPTRKQVAMVLHALADHTAIMSALEHRPDPTSPGLKLPQWVAGFMMLVTIWKIDFGERSSD